ncbi:MAG: SMP-30/gluconolactonase/LRE family protein [Reichenbachiella sp.]
MIEKATVFAEGLDHPECIAVHPDGSLWAGGEAGQIYHITENGTTVKEVTSTGGFILGIAFSPGAEWMAICDLGKKCMWRMDMKDYSLKELPVTNHQFNIPNYAVFDRSGNLYVSESGEFKEKLGKVIKYDTDGVGKVWSNELFEFANGMALGKGGDHLYIVSSFLPGIERIEIKADGSPGVREVYCTLPKTIPDGISFDENGNLYVSCYTPNSIYKVTPEREVTVFVDDWEAHTLSNPTNTAFGGENFDQMFTANLGRWHITSIEVGVKGLKLASHI